MDNKKNFESVEEAYNKIHECDEFLKEWWGRNKNEDISAVIGAVMNIISSQTYLLSYGINFGGDKLSKEINDLKKLKLSDKNLINHDKNTNNIISIQNFIRKH